MKPVTTNKLIHNEREYVGAVIGTLLGDASLDPSESNSRLRFSHKNREYALWKKEILSWEIPLSEHLASDGMTHVYSPRLPLFTHLRKRMYYNGRKTIDSHVMKCLTPLGLALWYYDDGDLNKDSKRVVINSNNFTYAEHLLMQKSLFKNFGLRFNIHTRKSRKGNHLFYFRLKNSDRERFFTLLAPYQVDCMRYKFITTEEMSVVRNHSRHSKQDIDALLPIVEVIKRYKEGVSVYALSKEFHVNSGTILGRLRKAGVEIRNAGKYSSRDSLDSLVTERGDRNILPQETLLS